MSSNECTPSERLQQLCQDQRARWLRGDRVFVESFFDEHPELRSDEKLLLDFILAEYTLRHELGDQPTPAQYVARFPHLASQLALLFEVHDAVFATTEYGAELSESPGTLIGPYRLLQQIGEGGFGVVFMAEQTTPVRRMVALKVIKPGMDTRQVIARFESERQALALMDHPNVAKVLDAGATASGRPYFVMELVKGVPITEFCDRNHLRPDQRLNLFLDACHAIQHAHQKGVIHRDIKPNNVMVTLHDGVPVVKVIDFGLAKATAQRLTERTLFTAYGEMVGTPVYMSPEQAEMSGLDIDTRTDVYSLGVLLYELLTGTTPLELERLRRAAYAEMQRIIREEEPPRPSARLSSLGGSATILAGNRGLDVKHLVKLLSGDLDWIVMKSLEKDRNRRYDTPGNFADDIDRYLRHEPIVARPPSAIYKLKKFVQRNRGAVLTVALVAVALLAGTGVSTWQALRATRAETAAVAAAASEKQAKEDAQAREAETKEVLSFVENKIFAAARPKDQDGGLGYDVKLADALKSALPFVEKSFPKQPLVEARLRMTLGQSFQFLGDFQSAAQQEEAARALYTQFRGFDDPDTLMSMHYQAVSYRMLGRRAEALKTFQETLTLRKAKLGADHPDTLASMDGLANTYGDLGRYPEELKLHTEAVALIKAKLGPRDPKTLVCMHNLADCYRELGRPAEGAKLFEEVLAIRKVELPRDHPDTLKNMHALALCYFYLARYDEALKLHLETLALRKAKLGPDHPQTLTCMNNLATSYLHAGRLNDALKLFAETFAIRKVKFGPDHPDTLMTMSNLGATYSDLGRHADALKINQEALALQKVKLGPDHLETLRTMNSLAISYGELGRLEESRKISEEALARHKATYGPDHPSTLSTISILAETESRLNRLDEALKLRQELLASRKAKLGPEHPATVSTMLDIAESLLSLGRSEEAFKLNEQVLSLRKAKNGADHPDTLSAMNGLANCHEALGRHAEALKLREETLAGRKAKLGPDHPKTLETTWGLAKSLMALHREAEAMPIVDDCLQRARTQAVDPPVMPGLIDLRLRFYEGKKDAPGCRRTAEIWESLNRTDTASLYIAARLRAVTATVLRAAGKSADASHQADAEAERAMASLKQAVGAGYKDVAHLEKDNALESLRDREDFKKLLAKLTVDNGAVRKP
ncbi:MAG TPA: serine/threonine-protein kinase [Planctomycetaceae bacterium]|nr:serine/threonine-protein kinase [Planctomycetaceae bacterium]